METKLKPFTREWTIEKTLSRMEQCVYFSLEKVIKRLPEFSTDPIKSAELMQTIVQLIQIKDNLNAQRNQCTSNK